MYPTVIHNVAKKYNEALVFIEINDIGHQVADILHHDFEYENMISSTVKGRKGQIVSAGFAKNTSIGLRTTAQVKRIGCSTLKDLIEEDQLLILDFDTIAELTSFCVRGKSYAASEGCHDDLVMTLVLFAWCAQQRYFKELMDQELREQMYYNKIREIEEDLTPFGFITTGLENESFTDSTGQRWQVVE